MKTLKLKLALTLLALIPVIAFAQDKETRKISSFSKVHSSGMFDVELVKGSEESIKIAAENFKLDKIITEVEGGVLKIYKDKFYKPGWRARVKILVTYKSLEGIKNSGSGDMLCRSDIVGNETDIESSGSGNLMVEGTIKSDYVDVSNSGSGNISLSKVEANKLEMSKSGSGSFKVSSGNVNTQKLSSSGSGNMNTGGLESKVCYVKISGSGNCRVYATDELNARTSGSGSIQYKGSPTIDAHTSGSGSISSY
jgi:hypothetical protein